MIQPTWRSASQIDSTADEARESHRRRMLGLAVGIITGVAYGIVSQFINRVALPGIPFYQPPFGPWVNALLWGLGIGALGVVSAWPAGGISGTFLGGAATALVLVGSNLWAIRSQGEVVGALVLTSFFLWLPLWGLTVPLVAALRWGTGKAHEAYREHLGWSKAIRAPLLLVLVTMCVGGFALLRADARSILVEMHALLQSGIASSGSDQLPAPLAAPEVGDFIAHSASPYTLEWSNRNLNRFRIPRPGLRFDEHSVALAHFDDGWLLVCLYVAPGEVPTCKGFSPGWEKMLE